MGRFIVCTPFVVGGWEVTTRYRPGVRVVVETSRLRLRSYAVAFGWAAKQS